MTRWVGADPIHVIEAPPLHPVARRARARAVARGRALVFCSSAMLRRAGRRARDRRGFTSCARPDRSSRTSSDRSRAQRARLAQRTTAAASHAARAPTGEIPLPRGAAALITPLTLSAAARCSRRTTPTIGGRGCALIQHASRSEHTARRRERRRLGRQPIRAQRSSARSGQLTAYRADLPGDRRGRRGQRRGPGRLRRRPE